MYSFAGLIRRTLPPTFSDAAITDRHSNTTIFQLRVPPVGVELSTFCVNGEYLSTRPAAPLLISLFYTLICKTLASVRPSIVNFFRFRITLVDCSLQSIKVNLVYMVNMVYTAKCTVRIALNMTVFASSTRL